jgi:hypothetical protein
VRKKKKVDINHVFFFFFFTRDFRELLESWWEMGRGACVCELGMGIRFSCLSRSWGELTIN